MGRVQKPSSSTWGRAEWLCFGSCIIVVVLLLYRQRPASHRQEQSMSPPPLRVRLLAGEQQLDCARISDAPAAESTFPQGSIYRLSCMASVKSRSRPRTPGHAASERYGNERPLRKYHVLTVSGATIYQQWQMRIHYYTYLKAKAECERLFGGACEMGGFTRMLATGEEDDLMDEIPTYVSQTYPGSENYTPLNRAFGYLQWIRDAQIEEDFVLFTETDTLFLRPVQNLMPCPVGKDSRIVTNPFNYLNYSQPKLMYLMSQFMPSRFLSATHAAQLRSHGNSPVIMSMKQFKKVAPLWHKLNVEMLADNITKTELGWMLEMYSFTLAIAQSGVGQPSLVADLVAFPPYDKELVANNGMPFSFAHYAFPLRFHNNGTLHDTPEVMDRAEGWNFYKHEYIEAPPSRNIPDVPPNVDHDMVRLVMSLINEATSNIPCWDDYVIQKRRPDNCTEVLQGSLYPNAYALGDGVGSALSDEPIA